MCQIQTKTQTEHSSLNTVGGKLEVIMTCCLKWHFVLLD